MKDGIVCAYEHDNNAQSQEQAVYVPNILHLNQCIDEWTEDGIEFCGIVHSHPSGQDSLSDSDVEYIKMLYEVNPQLEKTFFPLVLNGRDIIVYAVERSGAKFKISVDSLELEG